MDDFTPEQLATVERFMNKHSPFLKEIVKLGQKIQFGQSNITVRWHEGKGTDVLTVTNFIRKRVKGDYAATLEGWFNEIQDGQVNVTFQVEGGKVTDMVNAVAYERRQFKS